MDLALYLRRDRRHGRYVIVGALLGQMKLVKPQAKRAAELFGLNDSEMKMLNEVPIAARARRCRPPIR